MKLEKQRKTGRLIPFLPDGEYYYDKGIAAYQHGDLERAKKFVERAIAFNPNEPDYLCQLAAILAEMEQFEASNRLLKKVVFELEPSLAECFFFMANNYAYLGRYEEALNDIKRYMSLEPNGTFFQEARELYQLLVVESGSELGDVETYISDHEIGRQALERGEFSKAVYYFKKVIKERPQFWAAQNNLAIAYFSNGESEKGLEQLDVILQNDPGNVHALCNKVTFYFQMGDQVEVDRLLPSLDVLYPLYPEGRSKLGATYFFLGHDKKAFHWLCSAERTGLFWEQPFYYWLAVTSYRLGYLQKAFKAWKHVDFFSQTPFQPFEYGKIKELLNEEGAARNQLVRSLLEHEIYEGTIEAQLASLFILHHYGDETSAELLLEASKSMKLSQDIRQTADRLYRAVNGEHINDSGLLIMLDLQNRLSQGEPLLHELKIYTWWLQFINQVDLETFKPSHWSAALEYHWCQKMNKAKVTQAEIAEMYGLSLYKLRQSLALVNTISFED